MPVAPWWGAAGVDNACGAVEAGTPACVPLCLLLSVLLLSVLLLSAQFCLDNVIFVPYIQTKYSENTMSLIFSRHCEYALQAVLFLALRREGSGYLLKS